jgi:hypothetical protein
MQFLRISRFVILGSLLSLIALAQQAHRLQPKWMTTSSIKSLIDLQAHAGPAAHEGGS